MFTEYQVRNFKCFVDTGVLRLGMVTVLLGRNNSGKSSFVQPLQMLAQTLGSEDSAVRLAAHDPRDFGRYFEWVHRGETERDFGCSFVLDKIEVETVSLASQRERRRLWLVAVDVNFGLVGRRGKWKRPKLKSVSITLSPIYRNPPVERLNWQFTFDRHDNPHAVSFNDQPVDGRGLVMDHFLPRNFEWDKPVELYVSDYAVIQLPRYFYSLDKPIRQAFDIVQVAPIRPAIPRVLCSNDTDAVRTSCPTGAILASLYRFKTSSSHEWSKFRNFMDRWLGEELGFVTDFDLTEIDAYRELFALQGRDAKTGALVNLADTGYGVAQVLPVLLQLYFSRPGQLVLIEEPELHLNPAAQRVLFDLVQEFAAAGRQIVIETHSEHFLLRLRRRSIEQPGLRDTISLYYVDQVENRSELRPLALTEDGRLENWPDGFLNEAFDESVELMKQLSRRGEDQQDA